VHVGAGEPVRRIRPARQVVEGPGRRSRRHLRRQVGRDGRVDVADPNGMDAGVRRMGHAPDLQEQVEALPQVGVADADGQQRTRRHAQLLPHRRTSGCGGLRHRTVQPLRQQHRPVRRHGGQLVEPVADDRGGEDDMPRDLGSLAGRAVQVALQQQPRQLVHHQGAGGPGGRQLDAGPGRGRAVHHRGREAPGMQQPCLLRQLGHCYDRRGRHGPVLVQQRAIPEQQECDVHAHHLPHVPAQAEQQHLRPGREGVMPDQEKPRPRRPGRRAGDGAGGRVQVRAAEMHVRLQVGALRPLVPGVDADDRRARDRLLDGGVDQPVQPGAVLRRSGAV